MNSEISKYEAFVFDLDGVVWLGPKAIPGVAEAVNELKRNNKKIRFLTNNACDHREKQFNKLIKQGIDAELEEVFTAGSATALYVLQNFGKCKVHVMGTSDLAREMTDLGHKLVERNADVVVTGLDKEFNWEKLNAAFQNIHCDKARLIACNGDPTYPSEGRILPGAGSNLASLVTACGRDADIIVGKPNAEIFSLVLSTLNLKPEKCLMTGDKIETDIIGARQVGMASALVLTGIGSREDTVRTGVIPEHIFSSVADY
jgi:HAD superfamily hydrolase (TIGR01450 family)